MARNGPGNAGSRQHVQMNVKSLDSDGSGNVECGDDGAFVLLLYDLYDGDGWVLALARLNRVYSTFLSNLSPIFTSRSLDHLDPLKPVDPSAALWFQRPALSPVALLLPSALDECASNSQPRKHHCGSMCMALIVANGFCRGSIATYPPSFFLKIHRLTWKDDDPLHFSTDPSLRRAFRV